jgi:hypothetical protein
MEQDNREANGNKRVEDYAELGFGSLLVAEDEEGGYEPVALVSTLREARELAAEDFRFRLADVENGKDTLCPARYATWVRRSAGYTVLTAIEPD